MLLEALQEDEEEEEEERAGPTRVPAYAEEVVPAYSLSEFRSHFRMNRATFEVCILSFLLGYRFLLSIEHFEFH